MSSSTETPQQPQQQKPAVLEEDDEFEDFPVEGECSRLRLQLLPQEILFLRALLITTITTPLTTLLFSRINVNPRKSCLI